MDKPDIAAILEHYGANYVPLGNRWRKVRCPFHEDRQASASVNTDEGKFKCFACDVNGDAFDLVMWKEGTRDFVSAKQTVARILGVSESELLPEQQAGKRSRRIPFEQSGPQRGQRSILQARTRRKPLAGA